MRAVLCLCSSQGRDAAGLLNPQREEDTLEFLCHPGHNLLFETVAVKEQTMEFGVSGGAVVFQTVHQQVISGDTESVCDVNDGIKTRLFGSGLDIADVTEINIDFFRKCFLRHSRLISEMGDSPSQRVVIYGHINLTFVMAHIRYDMIPPKKIHIKRTENIPVRPQRKTLLAVGWSKPFFLPDRWNFANHSTQWVEAKSSVAGYNRSVNCNNCMCTKMGVQMR